jgi:hypothetical protein
VSFSEHRRGTCSHHGRVEYWSESRVGDIPPSVPRPSDRPGRTRAWILGVERDGDRWMISVVGPEVGSCPGCRAPSTRRHSRYFRHLQDLTVQGAAVKVKVKVKMRVSRWRCLNRECERETFTDQPPEIVCPHARRTQRIAELVHLFGHGAGGRSGERLMKRLGMPVSDDTILRHLKRRHRQVEQSLDGRMAVFLTGEEIRLRLLRSRSHTRPRRLARARPDDACNHARRHRRISDRKGWLTIDAALR